LESLVFLMRLRARQLVRALLAVAQLALDRLHLLVEVVLALRLLHLALDARADALLHLQHADLAFHQAEHLLQPLATDSVPSSRSSFSSILITRCGDGVGELGVVLDLADGADDLGRDLLVELHVVLELGHGRARQRLGLDRRRLGLGSAVASPRK
jgi:hypothetical protein